MSQKLFGGVAVLAIFGAAIFGYFNFKLGSSNKSFSSQVEALNREVQNKTQENDQLLKEINSLKESVDRMGGDLDQYKSDLDESRNNLADLETQLEEKNQNITSLEEQQTELKKDLSDKNLEIKNLNKQVDFYRCDEDLDMDYSSVLAGSSRLMSYVDGLPSVDHVSTSFRNTIWNNADSKIYGIRYVAEDGETYATQFLVYFNEFGMRKGVFYVDEQCWLDSPVD
jgi:exonuclease VII large subunit